MGSVVRLVLAALAFTGLAAADTVYLKTGVKVDGAVSYPNANSVAVDSGKSRLVFQRSEVDRVENNQRTGTGEAAIVSPSAQQHEDNLRQQTGLDAEKRQHVLDLLVPLKSDDPVIARKGREALVLEGRKVNIVPFLEYSLGGLSPLFVPNVLRVIVELDAAKGKVLAKSYTENPAPENRVASLEVLTSLRDSDAFMLNARGAVDPALLVRIAAMENLAVLHDRRATPLLIACFRDSERQVHNVARDALETIWGTPEQPVTFEKAGEWQAFWETKAASVPGAVRPAAVTPLVDPADSAARGFVNE